MIMTPHKTPQILSYPFDLSEGLREAAAEICNHIPDLAHVDVSRVQFSLFYSRKARKTLTFARCYPLSRTPRKIGRHWHALEPLYATERRKARYILAFAWKRYWELSAEKRLETLIHELYHISPRFDGEFREFDQGGPHGLGLRWFDRQVKNLMNLYIPQGLEQEFPALSISVRSGLKVTGIKLQVPRWERLAEEDSA
jgi:predicted metallopeptidase